jgi:hypothetical protein
MDQSPVAEGVPTAPVGVPADTKAPRARRVRGVLAIVFVVLTAIAVLATTLSVWSRRTILNNDEFTSTIHDVVDDPRISDALARYVTDQVTAAIDPQQVAQNLLPAQASALAGPLANAIDQFVFTRAQQVVSSDAFINTFTGIVSRAHAAAIRLLEDKPVSGVQVEGDRVVLNLLPAIADVLRSIGADGLVTRLQDLPAFGGDQPPPEQVQQIQSRTGRQLPENFGQITVFETDKVSQAQEALKLFNRLVILAIVLTIVLIGATLLISTNRRRTAVHLGVGVALAMALAWVVTRWAQDKLIDIVSKPRPDGIDVGAATRAATDAFLDGLRTIILVVAVLAVIAVIAGFLAGPSNTAVRIRAFTARTARAAVPEGAAARFAAAHRDGLRIAIAVLGVVLLWAIGLGVPGIVTTVVVVAGGLVAVDALAKRAPAPA